MNIDRSAALLQRLQGDMRRILGERRPTQAQDGASPEVDRIWIAGRAGVQAMTRQQFERWR